MEHSIAIIPILLFLFMGMLAVALLALWVWVLVDCATNEPSHGNEKVMWIILIVLGGWLGALLYWIIRRPQRLSEIGK